MAQPGWQKPADGSDMLAIARIRWHRTSPKPLLMILQSALFPRFCHPQLPPSLRLHTQALSSDHGRHWAVGGMSGSCLTVDR
jgi:hypothetical protein